MKKTSIFDFALLNVLKSKNNFLLLLLSSILSIVFLFCISTYLSLNNYWKNTVKKIMDYRTLLVAYNPDNITEKEAMAELNSMKYVEDIAPYSGYLITMKANDYIDNQKDNSFLLVGSTDNPVEIVKGENLSKYDDNAKVMICAQQFYPYNEINNEDYDKEKVIDLSNKVGKTISLSFFQDDTIEEFKLVGVYDVTKTNTLGNVCYTKWNIVTDLNFKYQKDVYEFHEGQYLPIVVVVDDVSHIEAVESKLLNDGYMSSGPVVKVDTNLGSDILNKILLISILTITLLIIVFYFIELKNFKNNLQYYGVLKVYGFSSKILKIIFFIERCIINTIAIIISIPISLLLIKAFNHLFIQNQMLLNGFKVILTSKSFYIDLLIMLVFTIFISLHFSKKIKDINIIKLLRNKI